MKPDPIAVAPGYKFALLALPKCEAGGAPQVLVALEPGYAVTGSLPAGALDTWSRELGTFHVAELKRAHLILWALARSERPEVLDSENDSLSRDVLRFYLGLMIAVPWFSAERPTLLSGANVRGRLQVRTTTSFPRTYRCVGMVPPKLTVGHLQRAAAVARALSKHPSEPRHRIVRAIRAFRTATESDELDVRLHQFIRCAEGFAVPRDAKQFAARMALVCAGRCIRTLNELYAVRSGIEHLHGPYERFPKRMRGDRRTRLFRRCLEAEALARYLLATYLLDESLWGSFDDRPSASSFWAAPESQFRRRWPDRLPIDLVRRRLNVQDIERHIT